MKSLRSLRQHFEWLATLGAVLGPRLRTHGLRITALSLVEAALDLLSIGSVIPLLTIAGNPDSPTAKRIVSTLESVVGPLLPQQALILISVGIMIAITVRALVKLIAAWLKSNFLVQVRLHVARRLLGLYSQDSYERQLLANPSRRLTLVTSDAANVASLASDAIAVVASGVTVVAMALMMLILDWRVSLVALLVGMLISGAAYLSLSRRLRALGTEVQTLRMGMATVTARMLQGFQENAIYDRDGTVLSIFESKAERMGNALRMSQMLRRLPVIIAEWLLGVGVIAGICTLTVLGGDLTSTLPVAVAFAVAALRLGPAAVAAVSNAAMLRFHIGSLYDVSRDLSAELTRSIRPRASPSHATTFRDAITFDNVSFEYQAAAGAGASHVNAKIPQGTMLAVCGPSGAGKSTFVNLLMGLLTPTRGEVRVDGVPIRGREGEWQHLIALVPQEPFFWNASIRENILFGRSIADADARIWNALEATHLAEFARSLPRGLDTPLGDRGGLVSGGQRQRMAIARALIAQPELLVLDEPTSALDHEVAQAIDDALVDLRGKTTVVIVAHRAASVARCDQVVYLENGRIAATGTFAELVETSHGLSKTLGLTHLHRSPASMATFEARH